METQTGILSAQGGPASGWSMQNLAAKLPEVFNLPKVGDTLEGIVIKKSARNLYIDLGIRGIGIVYGMEFANAQNIIKTLKPGDNIFVKITKMRKIIPYLFAISILANVWFFLKPANLN